MRRLKCLGTLLAAAALAAIPANAADDRARPSRGSSQPTAVAAKGAPPASQGRSAQRGVHSAGDEATTLLAANRGQGRHVRGHVSIGYRHYRPYYRPYYVDYGWPYYGYYGYHAGWPYYRIPVPYEVDASESDVARRHGAVETDVRPGRAALRVDGEPAGQARDFNGTWDVLWLTRGTHELEFSRDGYQTLKVRVDVDGGSYYRIHQRLNKGSGLDPRSKELTAGPDVAGPYGTEPPRYGVEAEPPEPAPPSDPAAGMTRGFLKIEAEPNDAAVYLDGRFLANAGELARLHGALAVAEGEHTVEVVRPGFQSVKKQITVTADEPATVNIRLVRNGGAT